MNEQVIFKNLKNKSLHRSPKIRLDLAKVNLVIDPHDYSGSIFWNIGICGY